MGYYSFNCQGCGHSLISDEALEELGGHADEMAWRVGAVAVTDKGDLHVGGYDGFGVVGNHKLTLDANCAATETVWHGTCWEISGEPTEYRGPSSRARDQGFFVETVTVEPTTLNDLTELRGAASDREKAEQKFADEYNALFRASEAGDAEAKKKLNALLA